MAQVQVLAVDEEPFVQEPNLLQRFPPDHPKPSVQYFNISGPIMSEVGHHLSTKDA
jgi:hypothetical protein